MRVFGWFTVGLTKGSKELLDALLAIHPDGRQWTWPAPDGSRREYFQCELLQDDPKLQALINAVKEHGYRLWTGRGHPTPQDISFEYRRKYDTSDFEGAELLQPQPETYVGTVDRNPERCLLLSPESKFVKKKLDGLRGFDIGFTVPMSLIVSSALRTKFEQSGLKRLLFKPVFSREKPERVVPDHWELSSDYLMPPLANPELNDGFYTPVEYHYRASDLRKTEEFDFAVTRENILQDWPFPVVSQRFYRYCAEQKLPVTWEPIRIDPG